MCGVCVVYAPKCCSSPEASRKQFSESKGTVWLTLSLVQVVCLLGLLQDLLKGPECGVRQMKFTHNYGKNAGQFLFNRISHLLMSIIRLVKSYGLIQSSKNVPTILIMHCSSSSPNETVLVATCEKYVLPRECIYQTLLISHPAFKSLQPKRSQERTEWVILIITNSYVALKICPIHSKHYIYIYIFSHLIESSQ